MDILEWIRQEILADSWGASTTNLPNPSMKVAKAGAYNAYMRDCTKKRYHICTRYVGGRSVADTEFFVCNCGAEAVALWQYRHKGKIELLGLALWRYGADCNFGWRWELRHIWNIIRYGHPYVDDILLSSEDARRLGKKLIELAGEADG